MGIKWYMLRSHSELGIVIHYNFIVQYNKSERKKIEADTNSALKETAS